MSLQPKSFAEALAKHKPMKRGKLTAKSSLQRGKKKLANRSKKKISKDKVWREFSIYIRTRGADSEGFNTCVTCGARKFWRDLQAGHFIAGRNNSVLFCERGVWPQCYGCNVGKNGNTIPYYRFMRDRFGEQIIDELIYQSSQTYKWRPGELDSLYQKYFSLNQENPLTQIDT